MSLDRMSLDSRANGFTIIELVVVMGILSGFLVMLVQLVDAGLSLFAEGESGQAFADRTSVAQQRIKAEFTALRGSASGRDRDSVEDRLLVQWLPIGLPARPEHKATMVQMVRAAVQLPPDRELALLDALLMARIIEEDGELEAGEMATRLEELRATEPLRGIGNMMLLPWRQEGADDALLELRVGWFLPGQKVPVGDDWVDPFDVLVPGQPVLPAMVVHQVTTTLVGELLHCEFAFWSQRTQSWRTNDGRSSGGSGPETIWDSARGGWLVDEVTGGEFDFDRGPGSMRDPTDDIQPHAVRVTCVVAQPSTQAAEGLLARGLATNDNVLVLIDGDRWPGSDDGGYVKVRGEWLYYAERDGDRLKGLRRGQRRTKAIEHPAGVRAHHGQTVQFVIPVPHAKDDWNG